MDVRSCRQRFASSNCMSVVGLLFAFTVPFSVALVGVTFVAALVVARGRRRRGREAQLGAVGRSGGIGRNQAIVVGRVGRQAASRRADRRVGRTADVG